MEATVKRIPLAAFATLMLIALPHHTVAQIGDAARGARMYRDYVACHSLEPNSKREKQPVKRAESVPAPSCCVAWPRTQV
jgi:hypothetical protein